MRHLLITILLFSLGNLYAQSSIKVVVQRFDNGNPKLVRYFYSSKDTSEDIQVENKIGRRALNKPISIIAETYFENGQLEYKGKYIKGLAEGLFEFYYDNGKQLARSYYKGGMVCDSLFCYYSSGKLKRQVVEIDKTKHYWRSIDYFENGTMAVECYQIQQADKIVLEGDYRQWYENGHIAFEATLKNNWTIGKWSEWDEDGTIFQSTDSLRVPSIGEE